MARQSVYMADTEQTAVVTIIMLFPTIVAIAHDTVPDSHQRVGH